MCLLSIETLLSVWRGPYLCLALPVSQDLFSLPTPLLTDRHSHPTETSTLYVKRHLFTKTPYGKPVLSAAILLSLHSFSMLISFPPVELIVSSSQSMLSFSSPLRPYLC